MLKTGATMVLVVLAVAVLGPLLVPFDTSAQDLAMRLTGPARAHMLGLDELGRDILARVIAGARISLFVGVAVVSISACVGTVVGAVAGYFGGIVDDVISRVIDVLLAFPGLLLAIALVAVLGPSLGNVLIALTLIGWVGYARLVRGQVLRAREFEYVQAARAIGASTGRVLWRHVIPAAIPSVVVQGALGMAAAVIGEAALSFLGLGVQPPTPSWGTMLNGGRAHLLDAPHLTLFPGLAIGLLVLGFNLLGDGLRDVLDPRGNKV
jgi:peptide/nickel transport system permease protein